MSDTTNQPRENLIKMLQYVINKANETVAKAKEPVAKAKEPVVATLKRKILNSEENTAKHAKKNDLLSTSIFVNKIDDSYLFGIPSDCRKIDGKDTHEFGENYIYVYTSDKTGEDYYINKKDKRIDRHLRFKKSKKSMKSVKSKKSMKSVKPKKSLKSKKSVKPKKSIKRKH